MSMPIPLSTYAGRETWRKILKDEEKAEKKCTCFFEKHSRDLALLAFDELDAMQAALKQAEAERDWLALQLQRIHNGSPTRAAEKEWWLERAAAETARLTQVKGGAE